MGRRSDGETFSSSRAAMAPTWKPFPRRTSAATWKRFFADGIVSRRGNLLTWKRFVAGGDVKTFWKRFPRRQRFPRRLRTADVETFIERFHVAMMFGRHVVPATWKPLRRRETFPRLCERETLLRHVCVKRLPRQRPRFGRAPGPTWTRLQRPHDGETFPVSRKVAPSTGL